MGRFPEDLGLSPDLSRLPSNVLRLIRNGNRGEYPNHSEARVAICTTMFRAGYNVAEVWTVITNPANGISEMFFEEDGERAEVHLELLISETHYADRQQERREAQARGHITRPPRRQRNQERGQREEKYMTEKSFTKDLDGIYGMILVQEATKEEMERYANGDFYESPSIGLVRIDVAVRYEDDFFVPWDYPREVWEVPFRVFVAEPVWEDNPREAMRRLHSEIGRLLEEDWDRLEELWTGQRPRYAAPDDPSTPEI